ncbi:MAG: glycosyl transferase [Acidobacteriaceae bacterium]
MSTTHDMPLDSATPSLASPPGPHCHTTAAAPSRWPFAHVLILLGLWLIIFVSAVTTPPLLDDADATHAQAAQAMLATGNWVTLHVDGIRYLEKPPLPYWITAISLKLFAPAHPPYGRAAAFAVHFPLALTILALALLGYAWSRRAFTNIAPDGRTPQPTSNALTRPTDNQHAALYTGIFILTSAGVFLFTRVFIPDALLSLLLAFTLYAFLRTLHPPVELSRSVQNSSERREQVPRGFSLGFHNPTDRKGALAPERSSHLWPYAMWAALALAVLTKGLVAIIFIVATIALFLFWTNQLSRWRALKPLTGLLLFLAIAAPWHILAGLRNTGGANGHGFFWFYFINEHVLRFLGRRIPRDYNKLPGYLYWSLHLVWLFPWSLFAPAALIVAWRKRKSLLTRTQLSPDTSTNLSSRPESVALQNPPSRPESDTPTNLSSRPEQDGLIVLRSGETRSSVSSGNNQVPQGFSLGSQNPAEKEGFSPGDEQVPQGFSLGSQNPAEKEGFSPGDEQVPQGFSLGSHNPAEKEGFSPQGMPSAQTGETFGRHTTQLLIIFSALVLIFFSISTNQEYYTFPVYLPLLMLLAAALTTIQRTATTRGVQAETISNSAPPGPWALDPGPSPLDPTLRRALTFTFAAYTTLGLAISAALAYGLYSARNLPFVPDIGELLAHRDVGDYTLSMSHFFDLTGHSFAALRLPASLALIAFLIGPAIAWIFYHRRKFLSAILAMAATSTVFLVAAHIAFIRFNPMLSSVNFARTILTLERTHQIAPNPTILIFGDQAFGSSIPFYLDRRVDLVNGRTTSMYFGSTFPDAPPIFLTSAQLAAEWGQGPRKILFVPLEKRDEVDQLLGTHQIILQQTSGKALITDRPLNNPQPQQQSSTPKLPQPGSEAPQQAGTPRL